jgi:hypothetical protein
MKHFIDPFTFPSCAALIKYLKRLFCPAIYNSKKAIIFFSGIETTFLLKLKKKILPGSEN